MKAYLLKKEQAFIRYVDLPGQEPPCVFVHGALDSSIAGMAETAAQPPLAHRRRLLIDLLGYGLSDKPKTVDYTAERQAAFIIELLDALAIRGCQLIGHSMGGAIAVMVASERPDLVGNLVLAEGSLGYGPGSFFALAEGKSEEEYVNEWFPAFIATRLEDAKTEQTVLPIHMGMAQLNAPYVIYRMSRSFRNGFEPSLKSRLLSLDMPRAYLVGKDSPFDEDDIALEKELVERGGRWIVVPDAEHQMNFDNPAGFAQAISTALNGGEG